MGIRVKIARDLRESFSETLDRAFKKRWRRNVESIWNIFAMRLVTTPSNGKPFTPTQKAWVDGYSEGYADAHLIVEGRAKDPMAEPTRGEG